MPDNINQDYTESRKNALRSRDDVLTKAWGEFKQSKKEAEILQKKAKKEAVAKEARKLAETTCKETIQQLAKIRDSIISEAMALFNATWDQIEKEYNASRGK